MPLIVTPGQLTNRAEFYYQLSQLTSAGIGLVQALDQVQKNPPTRSYREPVQRIIHELNQGFTFTEAVRRIGPWLPDFDITLIAAGEQSGRIDQCFRLLSDHYNDRARLVKQMIADLAYPVFLFHFALCIFALIALVQNRNWILILVGPLIPIYSLTFFLIYAIQNKRGETWRASVEAILHYVPFLGNARRCLALARLATVLESLISAGVTIIEAWESAAAASSSPALHQLVLSWRPQLNSGQTPAEVLNASGKFPDLFASQYTAGEVSGRLDETLRRLHTYYQEDGSRKIHALAKWASMFIYLVVVAIIAYFILQFYVGYFRQVNDAMTM